MARGRLGARRRAGVLQAGARLAALIAAPAVTLSAQEAAPLDGAARFEEVQRVFGALNDRTQSQGLQNDLIAKLRARPLRLTHQQLQAVCRTATEVTATIPRHSAWRPYTERAIANLFIELGEDATALERLRGYCSSLDLRGSEEPFKEHAMRAVLFAAQLDVASGSYEEARTAAQRVIDAKPVPVPSAEAHALLALVDIRTGRSHAANQPLRRAEQTLRQADTHSRFVLEARLEYYLAIGSPSKVIDRLEREGGVGSELQGLFLGFALHILYVDGLKASREEAIAQLEFAAGALPVRQSLDARLLLIELYLDVEHQPSDNAYDLERATAEIQTCDKLLLEHPWPEQAARLEAFRARIGPRTTAQLQRQFETLGGLLRLWRRTPAQADGLGFLTNYHRRVIVSELIESLLALRGPGPGAEAAVGVLLKTQALASGAREAGVAKVTLDEVRRDLLVNGQGMLLFFPGRFRSHLLAVGHNVVKAFTLPRFPRLVQPIDALRNRLRESPVGWTVEDEARWAEQLTGPARELAKQLLPDEATALLHDWNCVTVVDQGMLRDLPLEALVMEDGTLVGERFAINHLGSLPFGVHLQRTRWHPPTRDALDLDLLATLRGSPELLGDKAGPSFDFGPWRSTLDDIFGDVHVVPEDHLTVTALPEQKLTGDVHHFVMHGAHDRRRGRSPGIALVPEGPDDRGLFGTAEAAQLRAAPLVVLSVCRSAQGVTARIGDEPILDSLGGGVLHARNSRCHSVVQSAADLKLRPHLELMAEVFRNIHAGDPVAVALQRARAAARQRGPDAARFRHAQVQVTGLGHRRLRQ